jgi:hypothetical protein
VNLDHGLLFAGYMPHLEGTKHAMPKPLGIALPKRSPAGSSESRHGVDMSRRKLRAIETYHRVHPVTTVGAEFGWARVVAVGTTDSRGREMIAVQCKTCLKHAWVRTTKDLERISDVLDMVAAIETARDDLDSDSISALLDFAGVIEKKTIAIGNLRSIVREAYLARLRQEAR